MIGWRSGQSPTCAVIFAVAGIICAALLSTPCWAGPTGTAQALEAFTITNPDPTLTATDFHLKVQSLSPAFLLFGTENLDVTGTTGPAGSTAVAQGSGTPTITVDWTGLAIGSGKSTIFGLSTVQMHNKVGITDAFWTYPGGSTIGVEIPGFGVFTDPQYFIGNDFTDPIGIRGLQFLVNVPEIPLDSLIPGETPGFGPAVPDFILDPISSTAFSLPSVAPGNFLYAQGETFDVVTGQVTGSFIQGHQAPVLEPPTLSLLGISTLALAGYRWYRGRRFTIGSPPKGQTHLKL